MGTAEGGEMGTRKLDVSAQELLDAILAGQHIRHIREGEFTIRDYIRVTLERMGEKVPYATAANRLERLVELGQLGTEHPVMCNGKQVRVFFAPKRDNDGD
jgi:hypothetical protein